ncbi:MAG: Hsp20/alpha crystallin family protein [Armatimonadota bacterium]
MFKDYDDLVRQMELEMQRCSAEAMRRLLELPSGAHEFWLPRTDVYETENELVVRVDLAGVEKETLHVSLSADRRTLSVRGNRNETFIDSRRKIRYYQLEVYFGSFDREIQLPSDVWVDPERLSAAYREGFLVVTLPKIARAEVSRAIPITEENG